MKIFYNLHPKIPSVMKLYLKLLFSVLLMIYSNHVFCNNVPILKSNQENITNSSKKSLKIKRKKLEKANRHKYYLWVSILSLVLIGGIFVFINFYPNLSMAWAISGVLLIILLLINAISFLIFFLVFKNKKWSLNKKKIIALISQILLGLLIVWVFNSNITLLLFLVSLPTLMSLILTISLIFNKRNG